MKKALILGCSHAAGSELGIEKFARANSYPALVAQMLGYDVLNMSIPGGSNDAIFRIFLDKKDDCDIIIVAWSGLNRSEIVYNNEWINILPGSSPPKELISYYQQWCLHGSDERFGRLNKIKNVIALNSLSFVPVINLESFWPIWDFQWPCNFHFPLSGNDNFWDWSIARNYNKTKMGHFELVAHQEYAKFIIGKIKL